MFQNRISRYLQQDSPAMPPDPTSGPKADSAAPTIPNGFAAIPASGMFSGFGSYLAELYPTSARGAGQGFCYNFGRAAGALFPLLIGILSESIGLGAAIALGAAAYGLSLVALLALPETRGRQLVVD